jgi:hypothetical protein
VPEHVSPLEAIHCSIHGHLATVDQYFWWPIECFFTGDISIQHANDPFHVAFAKLFFSFWLEYCSLHNIKKNSFCLMPKCFAVVWVSCLELINFGLSPMSAHIGHLPYVHTKISFYICLDYPIGKFIIDEMCESAIE